MIENPNIERLATDPEPDLERSAGDGYAVTLTFTPSLEKPQRAVIQILAGDGKLIFDTIDLPAEEGLSAFKHTTLHSDLLTEALR